MLAVQDVSGARTCIELLRTHSCLRYVISCRYVSLYLLILKRIMAKKTEIEISNN